MSCVGIDTGLPKLGCRMLFEDEHQDARFGLRAGAQRKMHGHLVAVEVRVVRRADERMQMDRLALDQHRLEGLNARDDGASARG